MTEQSTLSDAIEALTRAATEIARHDSHHWNELSSEQRITLYRKIHEAQRTLTLADAPFLRSHEKEMPPSQHRQISYLKRVFALPHREAKERLASFHRLDREYDDRTEHPDPNTHKPEYMPHIRKAVENGELNYDAVATIDRAIRALPATAQDRVTAQCDEKIATMARENGPDSMGQISSYLKDLTGTDDPYTAADRSRKRSFTISPQAEDGMSSFRGLATPELAASLQRLFADYAKPGDLIRNHATNSPHDAAESPDPLNDERLPEQRRHDALEACLLAGFGHGSSLTPRRGTTTIVATARLEDVLTKKGKAVTDTGTMIDVDALISKTDCTDFYIQLLDLDGTTLYLGRSTRLASLEQYLALVGEELLSSAPGSSAMAAYCHVHHIDSWKHGGPTDLDNLTFVSAYHHGTVDDTRTNPKKWHTKKPPTGGDHHTSRQTHHPQRVHWIPPEHIDPERTPQSNQHPLTHLSGRRKAQDRTQHESDAGEPEG